LSPKPIEKSLIESNYMLLKWVPFSLCLIFVTGIIAANDLGRLKGFFNWVGSQPFGDKLGHLILIGTLTFLLNHALNGRMVQIGRAKILLGCAIVGVAITVEEFSQIWIPSRSFDLVDLAANYLGIGLAGLPWLRKTEIL
jgi:polysaccharide biosynthesis protein VpsQ